MNMNKSRTKLFTIALILVLTISATIVALPTASAHDPAWNIATYAFINVAPDPIGVNQRLNVIMWLDKTMGGALLGNDMRFHNYTLTITKPDGEIETQTFDVCWDPTSSQYVAYNPNQIGVYTFKFEYLGQTYEWGGDYANDVYLPSNATTSVTVQEEQITAITSYPLPNEYWTRPIYGENSDWWSISSNWLGEGGPQTTASMAGYQVYVPDAVGSQTAHIMWTKPLQSGGVVGGESFYVHGNTYFEGTAYIPRFVNPIILDGMLFYTEPISFADVASWAGSGKYGATVCVDLRTGEELWSSTDVPALSFGLIFDVQNPNQHGVYQPIIVATSGPGGSTWQAFDAYTGVALFNATNVPSGTDAMGPNGEYMKYTIENEGTVENPNYRLCQWNSSKLWYGASGIDSVIGGTVDASISGGEDVRYDWRVSIPWLDQAISLPSWTEAGVASATPIVAYYNDLLLCYNGTLPSGGSYFGPPSQTPYTYFAVNLNPSRGELGSVLWMETYNAPPGNITVSIGGVDQENHVWLECYKETIQWVAYSMETGKKLWGPTASQDDWDYYGVAGMEDRIAMIGNGKIYSMMFSGILYCYDEMTGKLLWTYGNGGPGNSTGSGYYNAYGVYPTAIFAMNRDIIYTVTTEHTVNTPIYKGALARAINATDGTELWTLSSFTNSFHSTSYAIADGFSTWFNGYDNQIYVVGRGPSATTVKAPDTTQTLDTPLLIQGTVIDMAAGTKQDEQAARFPNGVAAVSDESMTDWMGYVYQQRPYPKDVTGVEVVLNAVDSDGKRREIGKTTSDATGFYSFMWKPPESGKYTIIAAFEGTDAYWGSSAETAIGVTETASITTELIILLAVVAVAVIIIVGYWILRNLR